MGPIALALGIVLYLLAAWDFYRKSNFPLCWVFVCYALSNIGFLCASLKAGDPGA